MASLQVVAALAAGSLAAVWAGATVLERSTRQLADHFDLPSDVRGAVVTALGSSFPEFIATVVAITLHDRVELAVGIVVGSAVFKVLVVPGVSTLLSPGSSLQTDRELVYQETGFYVLSVATVLLVLALSVIYNPVATGSRTGELTRQLVLAPLGLYLFFLFLQYADAAEHGAGRASGDHSATQYLTGLVVSLVFVGVGVEGLVRAAIEFSDAFGTSEFLWGLTVVGAGVSVPEVFVGVLAARNDEPGVSISTVLGSSTFDLLVAIPVAVLVVGAVTVNFGAVVPLFVFLVGAALLLLTVVRTDLAVSTAEAVGLLFVYGGFLAWMAAESVGRLTLLG
ncbi:sodium:calcium antiporter [Haloglomus halophilum]|uniref:sodium:calcium antiporter n=1 Tax=Haloglomus halophilum TaxID=2962672 RepID=UPI0020C9400B|nr:sodium:calcium antiporter [Haloglomus halophilum]